MTYREATGEDPLECRTPDAAEVVAVALMGEFQGVTSSNLFHDADLASRLISALICQVKSIMAIDPPGSSSPECSRWSKMI